MTTSVVSADGQLKVGDDQLQTLTESSQKDQGILVNQRGKDEKNDKKHEFLLA